MTQLSSLFVPCDIALMAKEKGFNEFCLTKFEPKLYTKPKGDQILSAIIKTTFLNGIPKHYEYGGFEGYRNSDKDMFKDEIVAAPLYQQLVDWFEKEHELLIRKSSNGVYWELIDLQTCTEGPTSNDINDLLKEAFKLIK